MDFIIGLPTSKGLSVILVIMDRLTKSAHFRSLPREFIANKVVELFVDIVVRHHGFGVSMFHNLTSRPSFYEHTMAETL